MLTFDQAKTQIVEIITDASGVTIDNQIIFDLADSNGLNDLIKNSMIKDKLLASPELLLKKDTTLYMYDSSVVDIKVKPEGIEIDWHDSIISMLPDADADADADDADAEETDAEADAEETDAEETAASLMIIGTAYLPDLTDADKLKKNAERTARKRRLFGSQASSTVASSTVASDDESIHPMPVGIAPRLTKEAENYWPFMVCKAIIRKLHMPSNLEKQYGSPVPNFRSYYSVLDFLATKYNMCIDRLIKTNPINLIPFNTLKGILSDRTCRYLWDRKAYDDRYRNLGKTSRPPTSIMNYTGFNTDDSKTEDWTTFWHRVAAMTIEPSFKVESSKVKTLNDKYVSKTEKMNEIIKRMVADSTGDDSLFDTPRFITLSLPDSAT